MEVILNKNVSFDFLENNYTENEVHRIKKSLIVSLRTFKKSYSKCVLHNEHRNLYLLYQTIKPVFNILQMHYYLKQINVVYNEIKSDNITYDYNKNIKEIVKICNYVINNLKK